MAPPVFRFAPSPNGYLHLGHALSALLNFEMARAAGGRFLLRIEDIDATRCRPDYEDAIYKDLAWLGVTWDEPVRRQSEHFDAYRSELSRLTELGLLYPSFESRGDIARMTANAAGEVVRDPDGAPLYPGHANALSAQERERRITAGDSYALRIDMPSAIRRTGEMHWTETGAGPNGETGNVPAQPKAWGDVVLARKETPTSYHLAVVIDDALQGVTHVLRGQDLFWSTSVHRLLQKLLGLPEPVYHHHRLILDSDGRKLSKSSPSTALRDLRADGVKLAEIRRFIGLS